MKTETLNTMQKAPDTELRVEGEFWKLSFTKQDARAKARLQKFCKNRVNGKI